LLRTQNKRQFGNFYARSFSTQRPVPRFTQNNSSTEIILRENWNRNVSLRDFRTRLPNRWSWNSRMVENVNGYPKRTEYNVGVRIIGRFYIYQCNGRFEDDVREWVFDSREPDDCKMLMRPIAILCTLYLRNACRCYTPVVSAISNARSGVRKRKSRPNVVVSRTDQDIYDAPYMGRAWTSI